MVLQSTNQHVFLHLVIHDTLTFPHILHNEPKLVRIFIPYVIEYK